jgi:putative transposase
MDDIDRNRFIARLSDVIQKTLTPCFAWSLIPNHFHLLLQTGTSPIATVMEKLLTGYAGEFNRRHNRHGHLFLNRYKSILCQTDPYLLELVRYIHLNPIRAGIVGSFGGVENLPLLRPLSPHGRCPSQLADNIRSVFTIGDRHCDGTSKVRSLCR